MFNFYIAIIFLLISPSDAMAYGKIFPTHLHSHSHSHSHLHSHSHSHSQFQMKNPTVSTPLVVKNVSDISDFYALVHLEDDTRRILELREGVSAAKAKYTPRFTFKCICGTTYASVFGTR
jgi:hypothetical protein